MKRRAGLIAGVSVAAAAAGLGTAWWQGRSAGGAVGVDPNTATNTDTGIDPDIRTANFPQPDGRDLRLAEFTGRPLLLNFWATWCPPCVTELPLLDSFHRDQPPNGWRVVGLAVDQRQPVIEFLKQRPVSFPVGLAGLEGVSWSRRLGNTTGALPFTVLFARSGAVIDRKLGAIHADDLARWRAQGG